MPQSQRQSPTAFPIHSHHLSGTREHHADTLTSDTLTLASFKHYKIQQSFKFIPDEEYKYDRIAEIGMWNTVLIARTISGVCAAWEVSPNARPRLIEKLDLDGEEMASFFINTFNNTLITIAKYYNQSNDRHTGGDKYRLYCRAISLHDIQYGINLKKNWRRLYGEESINHPGYIEFHSSEGIAVTMCCERKLYRVWSLKTSQMLYQIPFADQNAIYQLTITGSGCLCCVILSIGTDKKKHYKALTYRYIHALTGEVIKDVKVPLCTKAKLEDPDSVEVENMTLSHTFGRWIIHKERNYNALIIDITTPSQDDSYNSFEIQGLEDNAELTFIEGTDTFLATYDARIDIWDCTSRCIIGTSTTSMSNNGFDVSGMYVSEKGGFVVQSISQRINSESQEYIRRGDTLDSLHIASLSPSSSPPPPPSPIHQRHNLDACIKIFSTTNNPKMGIFPGKEVASLGGGGGPPYMGENTVGEEFRGKAKTYYQATALYYDEDKRWIVTGDFDGNIHIWHA